MMVDLATRLLTAFAACDLDTIRATCAEDVVVYGTDRGELWRDRESLLAALDEMRGLEMAATWDEPPAAGDGWAAGIARYTVQGSHPIACV